MPSKREEELESEEDQQAIKEVDRPTMESDPSLETSRLSPVPMEDFLSSLS